MVTLIADKNLFNPVVEWVQSAPWDGASRVEQFYGTVVENRAECLPETKRLIMRKWAVSAIAAAFSPNGIQARGVMVFQGQQYAGKTRWIDSLAPKDLEFVKTGRALNVHDKDSVKQIISCWISELGELDATFKKSDIAALKAFITNDSDELRRPYAEGESKYARRTVFAASVNEKRFLQDDTGNSRFWVISIDAIRHDHGLNMQQVWAEFYQMWQAGETHYMTADEMGLVNANNETFMASDPISEMIESHLDWDNFSPVECEWMQPSDVLRWIGHKNPTKSESTLAGKAILRLNGGCHRKSNGRRLSGVPKTRRIITGVFG
jgi:putative DNA primase/helicase